RVSPTLHVLCLTLHHAIADGWSLGVLAGELAAFYEVFAIPRPPGPPQAGGEDLGERAVGLPELPLQYADFAIWQRSWLQGSVLAQQLAYWQQQLAGLPALALPCDFPRPPVQSFAGAHLSRQFSLQLSQQLSLLSRQQGATLFMTLLAAFQVLLAR